MGNTMTNEEIRKMVLSAYTRFNLEGMTESQAKRETCKTYSLTRFEFDRILLTAFVNNQREVI